MPESQLNIPLESKEKIKSKCAQIFLAFTCINVYFVEVSYEVQNSQKIEKHKNIQMVNDFLKVFNRYSIF